MKAVPLTFTIFLAVASASAQTRPSPPISPGTPYAPLAGPFYTPIPANPQIDPNSSAIIAGMMNQLTNGPSGTQLNYLYSPATPYIGNGINYDYNWPVYYSVPSDPLVTISCYYSWGPCPLAGAKIHMPTFAYPEQSGGPYGGGSGNSDHHMTIIDSSTGIQYDMWQAAPYSGPTMLIGWGSSGPLTSQGIGSFAGDHAYFAANVGTVRAPELLSGVINHALRFAIPCANDYPGNSKSSSGIGVYPSPVNSDQYCNASGFEPYHGMRIQLTIPPATIAKWNIPAYEKAVLIALATYGAYLTDTGAAAEGAGQFNLQAESALTYTQLGLTNPWITLANSEGVQVTGSTPYRGYRFQLDDMKNLGGSYANIGNFLQVIDPCVTTHSCTSKPVF